MIFVLNEKNDTLFNFSNNAYFINTYKNNILDLKQTIVCLNILLPKFKDEKNFIFIFGNFDLKDMFFFNCIKNLFNITIIYNDILS